MQKIMCKTHMHTHVPQTLFAVFLKYCERGMGRVSITDKSNVCRLVMEPEGRLYVGQVCHIIYSLALTPHFSLTHSLREWGE